MADAVAFDFSTWTARYPEFVQVPQVTAQALFDEAGLFWRNDGTSPNRTATSQTSLMNMMTAHLAALYVQAQGSASPGSAQDPNTPVGRVSNAAVGSVNIGTDLGLTPGTDAWKAWLQQTKYGFEFIAATTPYRTMHYMPGALQSGSGVWPSSPGWGGTFFRRR